MKTKGNHSILCISLVLLLIGITSFVCANSDTSQGGNKVVDGNYSQVISGHKQPLNLRAKTDLIAEFKSLCDAYPTKARYVSVGKSIEGNDIWAFCFGNPNSRGVVMWDGQMHGNEDSGSEVEYLFAEWLLTSHGNLTARRILERNYVVIIPVVNVDTYNRQNMRRVYTFSNGTTFNIPYGVNLNRNFVFRWGEWGTADWNSTDDYRGLYAGSEPETQAIRNAFQRFKPKFYVNTHQGGGPWLGWWHRNKNSTLNTETISLIAQISQQMNVTPYSNRGCGAGGFAVADAGSIYNASAWLLELSGSGTPPLSEASISTYYYPKCLPIFIAMCQLSEDATISEFNFDISILFAVMLLLTLAVVLAIARTKILSRMHACS